MPALTPEQEALKQAALAADQEGQHIYTSWRDSNNSDANEAWHKAASPAAILALLAQLEKYQRELHAVRTVSDANFMRNIDLTAQLEAGSSIPAQTGTGRREPDAETDAMFAAIHRNRGAFSVERMAAALASPSILIPPNLSLDEMRDFILSHTKTGGHLSDVKTAETRMDTGVEGGLLAPDGSAK